MSLATSGGARVAVEMQTNSLSFGSNGFVQLFSRSFTMDERQLHPMCFKHVQVWVTGVIHSASHHFSELLQVHTTVLRSEVIPLHTVAYPELVSRGVSNVANVSVW